MFPPAIGGTPWAHPPNARSEDAFRGNTQIQVAQLNRSSKAEQIKLGAKHVYCLFFFSFLSPLRNFMERSRCPRQLWWHPTGRGVNSVAAYSLEKKHSYAMCAGFLSQFAKYADTIRYCCPTDIRRMCGPIAAFSRVLTSLLIKHAIAAQRKS